MCKTIKQKVQFKAPPREVYRLLADAKYYHLFSGRRAMISQKVGGRFSLGRGAASGINIDLRPGVRIVRAWRVKRFPEGIFSMASLVLSPTVGGGTALVLTHRGVPKELIPEIERSWKEDYWDPIKRYLLESSMASAP